MFRVGFENDKHQIYHWFCVNNFDWIEGARRYAPNSCSWNDEENWMHFHSRWWWNFGKRNYFPSQHECSMPNQISHWMCAILLDWMEQYTDGGWITQHVADSCSGRQKRFQHTFHQESRIATYARMESTAACTTQSVRVFSYHLKIHFHSQYHFVVVFPLFVLHKKSKHASAPVPNVNAVCCQKCSTKFCPNSRLCSAAAHR